MNWPSLLEHFSSAELTLLAINLLLLLISRPLLQRIFPVRDDDKKFQGRLNLFRLANIMALVFVISRGIAHPLTEDLWLTRLLGVLLVVYLAYFSFYIASRLILRRYGRERLRNEEKVYVESYNSRLLTLVIGIIIGIVALVAVIRIMGFSTLLEAGGVLGVIGVMLALTQGSWVPDLISGLVILNSRLVEEGDVVQLGEDASRVGMVFRTRVFFTEILDLANNHRIMIQNSRLRGMTVHNLSRFASAKGLREALVINVAYETTEQQVRGVFEQVMAEAAENPDIPIEEKYEAEVRATRGGDYAVEWTCFYYIKETRHLLRIRQLMLALLLRVAREQNLSLVTPVLYQRVVNETGL